MAYAIYQHQLAPVKVQDSLAQSLMILEAALKREGGLEGDVRAWAQRRYDAMMADIEKVARWKFENGHV